MKKLFSILSLCFLLTLVFTSFQGQTQSNSEPPTWARVYYEEAEWMQVYSVLENNTNDGYFITGYSSSWILKLSSEEGDVEWKQADTYPDGPVFDAHSIQQTIDGGYVAIGNYTPPNYVISPGFGVIKFSQQFDIEWARNYNGPFYENPFSIQQTSDGGYILAGATFSFIDPLPPEIAYDVWVLKLSSTGDVEWQKVYGGLGHEIQRSGRNMVTILETGDGGYIFACDTNSFGAGWTDLWLVKLTSTGDIKWQKTYGGAQSEWFSIGGPHIQLTNDGGYIIAGSTLSFGVGYSDVWILRISPTGDIEWQKTYGGASGADFAHAIQPTNDGGYVITGGTNSFGVGSPDFWLLKISADGDIELQKTYGGDGLEEARCVQQTSDGGYIMAGTTNSFTPAHTDTLVIKVSPTGELGPGDGLIKVRNSDAVVQDTYVSPSDTTVIPRVTNGSASLADPVFAERELLSEVVAWPLHPLLFL